MRELVREWLARYGRHCGLCCVFVDGKIETPPDACVCDSLVKKSRAALSQPEATPEEHTALLDDYTRVAGALTDQTQRAGRLEAALRGLLDTWNRAESNRGCYSCAPNHDCRCEWDRKISDDCTCGRDELETAAAGAEAALTDSAPAPCSRCGGGGEVGQGLPCDGPIPCPDCAPAPAPSPEEKP